MVSVLEFLATTNIQYVVLAVWDYHLSSVVFESCGHSITEDRHTIFRDALRIFVYIYQIYTIYMDDMEVCQYDYMVLAIHPPVSFYYQTMIGMFTE